MFISPESNGGSNVCPLLRILSGSSLSSARVVRLAFSLSSITGQSDCPLPSPFRDTVIPRFQALSKSPDLDVSSSRYQHPPLCNCPPSVSSGLYPGISFPHAGLVLCDVPLSRVLSCAHCLR